MTTEIAEPISPEQRALADELVATVVASFDHTPDPRLKELMQSLTRHLHAFIRDVRLTEVEWNTAIEFLTAAGHITDARRQEFVLLSDVLGASMQTIAVNNRAYKGATDATVFGPFFVDDAPEIPLGGDIAGGASGQPCWVEGTVTDTDGNQWRVRASRCGSATRTVSTTCNTATNALPDERTCSPTTTAGTGSGA